MKCKQCGTALEGRQREYCSDKCRKRASRTNTTHEDCSGLPNADKAGHNYPLNPDKLNADTTRTPIPGDPGYAGVCKCINGVWVVKPDPPAPVSSLSDVDLQLRLKSYAGASWTNSPEHKEVLRRRAQSVGVGLAAAPVHERKLEGVTQP